MSTTRSLTITLSYTGTEFTRRYKFSGVDELNLTTVKSKIAALNTKIANSDSSIIGLRQAFISDDFVPEGASPHGFFNGIIAAQYQVDEDNIINLAE